MNSGVSDCPTHNNRAGCEAGGCYWLAFPPWSEDEAAAPECFGSFYSRDNHNGNEGAALASGSPSGGSGTVAWSSGGEGGGGLSNLNAGQFVWKIPDSIPNGANCALRMRYNITPVDLPAAFATYL